MPEILIGEKQGEETMSQYLLAHPESERRIQEEMRGVNMLGGCVPADDDAFETGDAQVDSVMGIANMAVSPPLSPAQKFKQEKEARGS